MKTALQSSSSAGSVSSKSVKPVVRRSWLSERVWPFETWGFQMDGATIAVTDAGRGPTLLFVHTGMWCFVWRDVIARLASDFRCVTFDSPGTGLSDRLAAPEITLERASQAVTAVIERLDLRELALVFHDLGGAPALTGASKFPECTRGLVAVNTFGWKPSGVVFRAMVALMGSAPIREFDALTGLLGMITASSFGVGRNFDRESREAFLAGVGPDGLRAFHLYMRDARVSDSIYERAASALAGPFKTLPLLTIFGERNDPLGFQPKWKEMFPDARQLVVPKGNHFPMCDDPDLVANAIRSWHRERVAPST